MMKYIAGAGTIIVRADLPRESTTASGLHLPARQKADHYTREADNYAKSYMRGEFQIVSGEVLAIPTTNKFSMNMFTVEAQRIGAQHRPYQAGLSEVVMDTSLPAVGDKVWWGWKVWGGMETTGKVAMDGDDLVGTLSLSTTNIFHGAGQYKTIGPYMICEPIPQKQVGELIGGKLNYINNAGVVRLIGDYNPNNIQVGDCIMFQGNDRLGVPNPFSEKDWIKVDVQNVVGVNPPWIDISDLAGGWDAVDAHNKLLAEHSGRQAGNDNPDDYYNEIDWLYEDEKKRKKLFNKLYRSKWH